MRIVGGVLSGRRFSGPPGDATRPTAERVREAIASALEARAAVAGAVVLDLYAGTGALAFEALSRGAARAVLVDRDRRVTAAIGKSAGELGLQERVRVITADLGRAGPAAGRIVAADPGPFGLVFADPPYDEADAVGPILAELGARGVLAAEAWIVLEHAARTPPASTLSMLASPRTYRYGDTAVVVGRHRGST